MRAFYSFHLRNEAKNMVKTVVDLQVTFYTETRDQEFAGLLRRSYRKMKREIPYVEKNGCSHFSR